jgi:nuclear pore complex protein Nup133
VNLSLTVLQAQTFVLSTSHGQLFRLTLVSSGGRTTPTAHLFVRERQTATGLSRFLPGVLWGGAASSIVDEDVAAISAIALGEVEETGRDVWALTETNLQRWRLLAEGAEQLMSDDRIDEMVGRAIKVALTNSAPKDDYEFGLELLDVATPEYVLPWIARSHAH